MLNIVKMDLYRLFKTKSLWVIWFIMALFIAVTTYLGYAENEASKNLSAQNYKTSTGSEEMPNLGMDVTLPTEPGEDITVFDIVFSNLHGKSIALFIVIFAVIFSTADITSGYIKNIGGQVRNRHQLLLSKAFLLFLYTTLTLVLFILVQAVSSRIFFGYLKWGNAELFLKYVSIELLLHYALALICMTIAIVVKNTVFSIIFSILLCMNFMMILYSFLIMQLQKLE